MAGLLGLLAGTALSTQADATPFILTNGTADGQVSVGVDGFGAFGSSSGSNGTNAIYNPVGAGAAAGTTYQSGIAIRFGDTGGRSFLSSGGIGGSGGLSNPTVTGTATAGSSTFTTGGLSFSLTQSLVNLFNDSASQIGTRLDQNYTIKNTTDQTLTFEIVRYLDGDLSFDGGIADGGGLINGSTPILFETDSATGSADATTFVGIAAIGGLVLTSDRYQIDGYSGLLSRITSGQSLTDTIKNDSNDPDTFVDAGQGYDVTLALRNVFTLAPGQSATYLTQTIFGSGAPQDFPPPSDVPEPGTLALFGSALAGLAVLRRRRGTV